MADASLVTRAAEHLQRLCVDIPTRAMGTQGNRDATAYTSAFLRALGWDVETPSFQCMDWSTSGVDLQAGTTSFEAFASPYTLGVLVSAPLVVVSIVEELEAADIEGKVVFLRGDLAKEQLAPKHFPWWNPEEHQRIIAALERGAPAAILAATAHNPQTAGAAYPTPLIEDGDFDIPSAYMTEEEGQKLAVYAGREVDLEIKASRTMAEGSNLVARRNVAAGEKRRLVTAHIDTKRGTAGALDNAGGVVVLLLLGDLLARGDSASPVELVAFNGEEYYAASGEQLYLQENQDLSAIEVVINVDGAGYRRGESAFSLYECPDDLANRARDVLAEHGLVEGPQWYQGDHTMFVMAGRPAIAITSSAAEELAAKIIHTEKDTVEEVDPAQLAAIAEALYALIQEQAS